MSLTVPASPTLPTSITESSSHGEMDAADPTECKVVELWLPVDDFPDSEEDAATDDEDEDEDDPVEDADRTPRLAPG